ncbi:MAG: tRNA-specific adenosine deaminase [Desulfovibrio sp.]
MAYHRIMPSPPPAFPSWEAVMREALLEAHKAAERSEIPVGAVIVSPTGSIIGRGHNAPVALHDPTAHAEIMALRNAAMSTANYRLNGCVMAVTLEPCLMCVGAIVHARLAGVIFGAADEKAGAVLSRTDGFEMPLHNHTPWQAGGILEEECAAILRDFFTARRGKTGETPS